MEGSMSLFHFYNEYSTKDPATAERTRVARITWSTQLWREIPVKDSDLRRFWTEEGRSMPYVRDIFDKAVEGRDMNDCMVYTNADVCVVSDCAEMCVSALQDTDAFYSYRIDFNHDFKEPIPDDVVPRGDHYVGSDLYGFRVRWWISYRSKFPDMVVGFELWDAVIRHLIDMTNIGKPTNVPLTHYHRRHASFWENPKNRYRLKGQLRALKLGSQWMRKYGINPAIHGVGIQTQPNELQRH